MICKNLINLSIVFLLICTLFIASASYAEYSTHSTLNGSEFRSLTTMYLGTGSAPYSDNASFDNYLNINDDAFRPDFSSYTFDLMSGKSESATDFSAGHRNSAPSNSPNNAIFSGITIPIHIWLVAAGLICLVGIRRRYDHDGDEPGLTRR